MHKPSEIAKLSMSEIQARLLQMENSGLFSVKALKPGQKWEQLCNEFPGTDALSKPFALCLDIDDPSTEQGEMWSFDYEISVADALDSIPVGYVLAWLDLIEL